jgi:L-ascorbate metabolism protein UlaG (beta-lactamase superfamily)
MEITWYGHSCFRISERGLATVVCDPYDYRATGYEPLKLKADIVTISHQSPSHNYLEAVKGDAHPIDGPGEYEIGGVFITGVQTNGHVKRTEGDELRNTLYVLDYNGLTVAHLGDINRVPTQTEVEALGAVHIVLIPVGGEGTLNAAKAAEVISLLEPKIVIPMHYATPAATVKLDSLNKFLNEMGLKDNKIDVIPLLKVSGTSALPEDTRVTVLDYLQH